MLSRDGVDQPTSCKGGALAFDISLFEWHVSVKAQFSGRQEGDSLFLRNCCNTVLEEGLGVLEKSLRVLDQLKQLLSVPRENGETVSTNLLVLED